MTYKQVAAAQALARRSVGGALAAWSRLVARNTYTIDPRRPESDAADLARAAAVQAATAAAQEYAAQWAVENGVTQGAALHRVRCFGWIV